MTPRVLFVCVENSCRSQMAEAFAHRLGGEGVDAISAGSKPSGIVNPKAIAAMAELGYDLATHRSRSLNEAALGEFDAVVTMGCGDACPHVPAKLRLDWDLPDPKHMDPAEFNAVRDDIEGRVRALFTELGVPLRETSAG